MKRAGCVALGAALAVVVAGAGAASAHPFGEPQSVRMSAEDSVVTLRWSAPPDDLILLGGAVGALPERREIVFDVSPSTVPEPVGETDADRLTASEEVARYLTEHLGVRQAGVSCRPAVRLDELVGDGAELTFDCPATVDQVEIEVSMLTDLHEAYRTVAIGDGTSPDRTLYTVDDTVWTWTFGATPESSAGSSTGSSAGSGVWWLVAVLAGLAGAVGAGYARVRRSVS